MALRKDATCTVCGNVCQETLSLNEGNSFSIISVCWFAWISRNCFPILNNSSEETSITNEEIVAEPSITNRDNEAAIQTVKNESYFWGLTYRRFFHFSEASGIPKLRKSCPHSFYISVVCRTSLRNKLRRWASWFTEVILFCGVNLAPLQAASNWSYHRPASVLGIFWKWLSIFRHKISLTYRL